jgi:hypothetical protein
MKSCLKLHFLHSYAVNSNIHVAGRLYRTLQECDPPQIERIYMQKETNGHVLFWLVLYSPVFKFHHTSGFIFLLLLITWNVISIFDSMNIRRSCPDRKKDTDLVMYGRVKGLNLAGHVVWMCRQQDSKMNYGTKIQRKEASR